MIGFFLSGPKLIAMGANILGFFAKHWKPICILALIGTIYYQNTFETEWLKWVGLRTLPGIEQEYKDTIKDLERDLKHAIEQRDECERGRNLLKSNIKETNRQVDKWFKVSQELKDKQVLLTETITVLKAQTAKDVEQILAAPTPTTCHGAIQLLRDSAQEVTLDNQNPK